MRGWKRSFTARCDEEEFSLVTTDAEDASGVGYQYVLRVRSQLFDLDLEQFCCCWKSSL
jgi:hypothetical protein